jgi:hypothetical protein
MKKYILLSTLAFAGFSIRAEEVIAPQLDTQEQTTDSSVNTIEAFYQTLSTEDSAAFDVFMKSISETEIKLKNAIAAAQIECEQEVTDIIESSKLVLEQLKKFTAQETLNVQITVPVSISKEF